MARLPVPDATETAVLTKSARRCSLCFGLNGNLSRVFGQIAHIDRNHENNAESNLCFLCLNHHAEYDSTSRQVKNFKPAELQQYKTQLEEAVVRGEHQKQFAALEPDVRNRQQQIEHDQNIFLTLDAILDEATLREFLDWVGMDHTYELKRIKPFDDACRFLSLDSNSFIDSDLDASVTEFRASMEKMRIFLATHFFHYSRPALEGSVEFCLYPSLNPDRSDDWSEDGGRRYNEYAQKLIECLDDVQEKYRCLRRLVKQRLTI